MKTTQPPKNTKKGETPKQKSIPPIGDVQDEKTVKGNKEQFRRWLFIDKLLSGNSRGYRVKEITRMVNDFLEDQGILKRNGKPKTVSERTIYDDLTALESIFAPKIQLERIKDEMDGTGYVRYTQSSMSIFNVNISEEEYTRLKFILNQSKGMIQPEIFEETQGLIDKLYNPSPFAISKQRSMPTNIIQTEKNEWDGKWLNELIQNITNRHCILIEYNKTGLIGKRYRLAPLGLKEYRGKWYLIGHDLEDFKRDQKIFRVSRIQNMYRIQDPFPSITEYFDLQEYFKYSIGIHQKLNGETIKVVVLLKDNFWIQELGQFKINSTQTLTEIGVNEALLEFETYDSPELIELLLSLGKDAQLISPESVQRRLKDQLKEILNNY